MFKFCLISEGNSRRAAIVSSELPGCLVWKGSPWSRVSVSLLVTPPVAGVARIAADAPAMEEHGTPLVSSPEGHRADRS